MRHKGKSTSHLFCLLTFSFARGWLNVNTKERHCSKKLHFMFTVHLAYDASSPVTYARVLRKFVIQALIVGHFHYHYHLHIIINNDTFRDRKLWSPGRQQRPENLHWRLINCWRFFPDLAIFYSVTWWHRRHDEAQPRTFMINVIGKS